MRIARTDEGVSVHAPAKLNLFLEVLARRDDGFHELETLMVAIDVCDSLYFAPRARPGVALHVRWENAPLAPLGDLPTGGENIVTRAIESLRLAAGVERGAEVWLGKRIASQAGLGGASSDAAAALVAANLAWELHWPLARLAEVAATLGSDIPFFLGSPVAICRGRGERIESLEPPPPLWVVVVRPPIGLSTPAVYRECRPAEQPLSARPCYEAWKEGRWGELGALMANRLEPAAARLTPWIQRLRDAFAAQGCYGYQMSGSGSSYFGLCRHALHARRVAARLRDGGLGFVYATRTIGRSSRVSFRELAA